MAVVDGNIFKSYFYWEPAKIYTVSLIPHENPMEQGISAHFHRQGG